jgi:serine/threonine protein phosphatase 1
LPYVYEDPLRIFVHAGLEPGVPLSRQTPEDLMWIREPFLNASSGFEKHVVHGHTPVGPTLRPERTNIDSGAFMTGRLCVAGFLDPSKPRPTIVELIE